MAAAVHSHLGEVGGTLLDWESRTPISVKVIVQAGGAHLVVYWESWTPVLQQRHTRYHSTITGKCNTTKFWVAM